MSREKEDYEKIKADLEPCDLPKCNRIGVLRMTIVDEIKPRITIVSKIFCCKTHAMRAIQKTKMPRYSKKRMQRMATTEPLSIAEGFKSQMMQNQATANKELREDIERRHKMRKKE